MNFSLYVNSAYENELKSMCFERSLVQLIKIDKNIWITHRWIIFKLKLEVFSLEAIINQDIV